MSSSDPAPPVEPATQATLTVESAPGVEIRILDAAFTELAKGTVRLEAALEPGLYLVNWKTAGALEQEVVRLRAGQARYVAAPGNPANPALPPLDERAAVDIVRDALGAAPQDDDTAEIVVLIAAELADASIPAIQLFARDDLADAMPEDRSDLQEVAASFGGNTAARAFDVKPAVYRLRYTSTSGETLDQSVPAIGGRRTVVFMRAAIGLVLVNDEGVRKSTDYHGIDPGRTAIVSLTRGAPAREHAEAARVAAVLLNDLATGRTSLGAALLDQIAAGADPLLRLYAAAVIVQRIEAGRSPTLDAAPEAGEETSDGGASFDHAAWLARARGLIDIARTEGLPADLAALRWRIESLGGASAGALGALRTPPMLDVAWRWAVMRSTVQPDTIPSSISFRAATLGGGGAAPWLAWRTAAAKGGDQPDGGTTTAAQLTRILTELARETARAMQGAGEKGGDKQASGGNDALAALPLDLRALATSTLKAAVSSDAARAAVARTLESPALRAMVESLHLPNAALQALAGVLQMPAGTLRSQAEQAIEGLRRGPVDTSPSPENESAPSVSGPPPPPGLTRAITVPDDPHKGRFGGQATAGGLTLSASFAASGKDWVAIDLTIAASDDMTGESALFCLHDSFVPDSRMVPFVDGRATLSLQAWGGFTVGGWIPARKVELELDLALIDGAPRIIREL